LYALSKRNGGGTTAAPNRTAAGLRVLDLDKNNLKQNMRQPLVSFLAFDVTVREFGFADNDISAYISEVARALKSNKSLQIFRYTCSVTTVGTPPTTAASQGTGAGTATPSSGETSSSPSFSGDIVMYLNKQIDIQLRTNRMDWMDSRRKLLADFKTNAKTIEEEQESEGGGLQEEEGEEEEEEEDPYIEASDVSPQMVTSGGGRRQQSQMSQKSPIVKHSLHVLFASPLVYRNDQGRLVPLDSLDCDSEKQILITSFEEAKTRKGISVVPIDVNFNFGCTSDTFISVLTMKPTSLHLSTHGEETYIVMEDGKGGMHPLRITQLEEICRAADVSQFLKLVFVSACNSIFVAKAFHKAGVRNVVAVDSKISDKAAQVFTRAFYLSIALGDPIGLAFKISREAVRSSPLLNESSQQSGNNFILIGDGSDCVFPRQSFLTPQAKSSSYSMRFNVDFPDPKKWRLTDSKFLEVLVPGRSVDAYLTIVAMSCKRVVTVFGPEGYGKSAMLSGFVCKYLNERHVFEDGVVVFDLQGCRTVSDVQMKLNRLVRKTSLGGGGSAIQHFASGDQQLPYPPSSTQTSTMMMNAKEYEEEELERTISELSIRKCVLILDHVDQVLANCFDELRFFLGHLLDRTKGLRLVIATRRTKQFTIPGHDDLVHNLSPLSSLDSARLFLRCCPHYHNDLHARPRQGAPPPENFEFGLARHPICMEMEGNAKMIVQRASVMTYEQWTDMVDEVTEALMPLSSADLAAAAQEEETEPFSPRKRKASTSWPNE
jgi:hypothetical protein